MDSWTLAVTWGLVLAGLVGGGPAPDAFTVLGTVAIVALFALVAALAATSGLIGPMLSRHTSALAITVPGLVVALSTELPGMDPPGMVGVFVWSMLLPVVPVMLLGRVRLYRMTRRPATASTLFA